MAYENNFSTWRTGVPSTNNSGRKSGSWFKHSFVTVVVMVVLAGAGFGGWTYWQRYHLNQQSKAVGAGDAQSVGQVVGKVGKHIVLPDSEQPTMATVSDVSKVQGQAFFAHAANGDKVLVYAQAKKAILYRPSIDKIVEIAPLTSNASSDASQPSPTAEPSTASQSTSTSQLRQP